jgi:hypothetical protein
MKLVHTISIKINSNNILIVNNIYSFYTLILSLFFQMQRYIFFFYLIVFFCFFLNQLVNIFFKYLLMNEKETLTDTIYLYKIYPSISNIW